MEHNIRNGRAENPIKRANWLSFITFWYAIPTFVMGCRKQINLDTIYETLPNHKSNYLGNLLESKWKEEILSATIASRKPSLTRVLMKTFGVPYFCYGLVTAFSELCVKILQPLALGQFLAYYVPNQSKISLNQAYFYGGTIIVCSLLGSFLKNPNCVTTFAIGMKAKIACSSLVYRKALKLRKEEIETTGCGQILNMITNDINKFDDFTTYANYLWISPLQAIIITYFMYQEVGFSSVIGIISLILVVPVLLFLGNRLAVHRLNTAIKTDARINLMNEIITGIEAIKMYTWDDQFVQLVDTARRKEIKFIRITSYIKGIILALKLCLNHLALYITIVVYAMLYHTFNAQQVFVLISYYNILKLTLTLSFGYGISSLAELGVSIKRINEFLLLEEHDNFNSIDLSSNSIIPASDKNYPILLKNVKAKVSNSNTRDILGGISLTIEKGELVAVVGSIGSGKSSLLHAILKELPSTSGVLNINGTISYASQETWIFPATVQQNILFGLSLNKLRYSEVIKCCELERDIKQFPYGDKTIVGERGVTLSGGQKARIHLARAVYREADIYLLDDPLSAVDVNVGKKIFKNCICKLLKRATVLLVTHQLQYLKNVDKVVILQNGKVTEGKFSILQHSSSEFVNLLYKSKTQPPKLDDVITCEDTQYSTTFSSSIQSFPSVDDSNIADPALVSEKQELGSVSGKLYKLYFTIGSGYCFLVFNIMLFAIASISPNLCTYFLTYWLNSMETSTNGTIIMDLNENASDFQRNIYIYSAIVGATVALCIIRSLSFFNLCMNSSINLHDKLFRSIIRAPLRFFINNCSGRILNRFSKDIGSIDEQLPEFMLSFLDIALVMISSIILIAIIKPILIVPSAIYCISFYFMRMMNLITSTEIKRLEGITKSPIITFLNVSIQGLSTIRALNVEPILTSQFDSRQDTYSSTLYMYIVTEQALSFFVDVLGVVFISIVIMSFPILGNAMPGGSVGIIVSLAVGFTNALQFCVRQSTQMENQMISVERVLQYTKIEHEEESDNENDNLDETYNQPLESWPTKGKISFKNVDLKYSPEASLTLKNINFEIQPGESIGIIGRTGAGKSSIIKALFRLVEINGEILIDDKNIQNIKLKTLRSKISIIPQQPIFLSGSLRRNLDPFEQFQDEILWKALEEVELKNFVLNLPLGLQTLDCGSSFSVGQRQLVCMARAIICNNRILVLDEATASVDYQTDDLIQKTIKKKFTKCTVFTIAHRLNTVIHSDKIMVLDDGRLVQFDHPYKLFLETNRLFYKMIRQGGEESAQKLQSLAEKNYRALHPIEDLIKF